MKAHRFLLPLLIALTSLTGCDSTQPQDPPIVVPEVIHVGKVSFKEKSFTLEVGTTYQTEIRILPSDSTDKTVSYESNKPDVASVDENGKITALKEGNATITVKSVDGNITDVCEVSVVDSTYKNVSISYNTKLFKADASTTRCHEGDEIRIDFKNLHQGYTFGDFTARDAVYDDELEFTKIDSKTYKTKCPKSGKIKIEEHATAKEIRVYYEDQKGLIDSIEETPVGGEFTEITNKGSESGIAYFVTTYDNSIRVNLSQKGLFDPTSITVEGNEIELTDYSAMFQVELEEFDDFFLNMTVNYKEIIPPEDPSSLTVTNGKNFTLSLYADDKTTTISEAYPGQKVYVNAVCKSASNVIQEVTYNYYVSQYSQVIEYATFEEEGWYSFVVPSNYKKSINVKSAIVSQTKLSSFSDMVGEYLTFSLNEETKIIDEFSDDSLSIEMTGKITYNGKETFTNKVTSGVLNTSLNEDLEFGNGWFMFGYRDGKLVKPTSNNSIIAVRKENADDLQNKYSVIGERFVINENEYLSLMVNKNESLFNSLFIDLTKNERYFDVSYQLMNGENITSEDAIYYVESLGEKIFGVGYDDKGKCLIQAPMGVYMHDDEKLIIANGYVASIGSKRYSWSYSGGVLTLKNIDETINIELDQENMTYEVVSTQEGSHKPEFLNLTFEHHNYVSGESLHISVSFLSKESDIYQGQITYYTVSNAIYVFGFTATVDFENEEIEFVINSQNYGVLSESLMNDGYYKLHAHYEDGKMTFTDELVNGFTFKNITTNCYKFVY